MLILTGCTFYQQYERGKADKQAQLDLWNKQAAEAHKKQAEEIEAKKQQRMNYIAAKAEIECKKLGFRKGTEDYNKCAYVAITEITNAINQEVVEKQNQAMLLAQQQEYQNNLMEMQRKQAIAGALMNLGNGYNRQPSFQCTTKHFSYGDTTRCN